MLYSLYYQDHLMEPAQLKLLVFMVRWEFSCTFCTISCCLSSRANKSSQNPLRLQMPDREQILSVFEGIKGGRISLPPSISLQSSSSTIDSCFDIQIITLLINIIMNHLDRESVTLEEAYTFLKQFSKDQCFEKDFIYKDKEDQKSMKQQLTPAKMINRKETGRKNEEDSDASLKKNINKNRAIKRIIETSFEILQGFKQLQVEEEEDVERSSSVQFNIYLKQYNRVLQLIYGKESERLAREAAAAEEREAQLQTIYEYTVVEDFREVIDVATVKQRISKTNIKMLLLNLRQSLVVLRPNQLRIYDSPDEDGPYKAIKLHQIENVDYHNQPHIFIVLTVQKDKESSCVYLRFSSEKNQDKWDRALYCCYMSRKMKTKDRLFSIEYPEEDVKKKQKEQKKQIADFSLQVSFPEVIARCFDNDFSQKEESGMRPKLRKMLTEKSIPYQSSRNNSLQRDALSELGRPEQTIQKPSIEIQPYIRVVQSIESPARFGRESDIMANNTVFINNVQQSADEQQKKIIDNQQIENPALNQKIIPLEVHQIYQLQRKHMKGIILKKQKMFFNKVKLAYLKKNSNNNALEEQQKQLQIIIEALNQRTFQYWDYDQNSGVKEERKTILISSITEMLINQEKSTLCLKYKEKQITFIGEQVLLLQIKKWIELLKRMTNNSFN